MPGEMVRDYERLCQNLLAKPVFRGCQKEAQRVKSLVADLKPGTQYSYMVTFKAWMDFCRKQDCQPFKFDLAKVKEFLSQYKETTRSGYGFRLRKIFNFNGEQVKFWVKSVDNDLPECLTEEEVTKLLQATSNVKWRTLFKLTYEGALRNHETLGLKIKHIRFDKYGAEVFIPSTKSDRLWLRVIDSAPLLQTWLSHHPDPQNREAYLFPGYREGQAMTGGAYYLYTRRLARKAGIKKHVTPHILRHSRLAWLKKYGAKIGISDSVICKLYGRWSKKNAHKMLDRYGRIDPTEANDLVLKAYGKLGREEVKESLGKPRVCPRCKRDNDALSQYCQGCGMVLDEAEAVSLMEAERDREEKLGSLMELMELLNDPERMEKFKRIFE